MKLRRARALLARMALLGVLSMWSPARAQEPSVILLPAPHPTAIVTEALVRLRGELSAAGFAVEVADPPPTTDVRAALTAAALRPNVRAAIALGGAAGQEFAELWINDRGTGALVVRRVTAAAEPGRGAEVLSIRAMESLRAALLEVAPDAQPKTPTPTKATTKETTKEAATSADTATHPAAVESAAHPQPPGLPEIVRASSEQPATPPHALLAVEVGGLVLGSFEGLSPSLLALVRGERSFGQRFLGRLTLAGLGTRARVATTAGAAEVTQQLALVEAALRFRRGAKVVPFLSIGAGATHISAQGEATWPYQGKTPTMWAAIADVGAGVRVPLGERLQLAGELHAEGSYPYPVVRFLEATLARAGRPTLVATVSVVAWM